MPFYFAVQVSQAVCWYVLIKVTVCNLSSRSSCTKDSALRHLIFSHNIVCKAARDSWSHHSWLKMESIIIENNEYVHCCWEEGCTIQYISTRAVYSHSLVINSYPGMYLRIHLKGGIVCLNQYFPSNHDGMIDKYSPYRVGDITIWMMINDRYWQLCSLALVTNYFQE